MKEYFINEEITLKAQTLGIKEGKELDLELIMLESYSGSKIKINDLKNKSFEEIKLKKSTKNEDDELKIENFQQIIQDKVSVENGEVRYSFKIEDKVEKNEDIRKVNYIIGWIDLDADGIREYDEAVIIKINHRLSKETLRMGIFFDGTGNDISDEKLKENALSNVRKLFEVYPNPLVETSEKQRLEDEEYKKKNGNYPEREKVIVTNREIFPQTMCAYVRGVGSISSTQDKDWFGGGAFGSGGEIRIKGMLYYIHTAIEEYVKEYRKNENIDYYPVNLEFDIFGFSRGAALARHFVNLLKQHGIRYDEKLLYHHSKVKIRTLNVFDTVASFGLPGNSTNIGYSFHINPSYIIDKIHHFLADDEFRINFPAHLISNNDKQYPIDLIKDKFEEIVFLGAHSDIGGGYPSKLEHNISNNELSKYYLNKMYIKCKEVGLPLNNVPENSDWKYEEDVKNKIEELEELYNRFPLLKIAHKKLREKQAYLSFSYIENRLRQIEENNRDSDGMIFYDSKSKEEIEELNYTKYKFSSLKIEELEKERNELLSILSDEFKVDEFINSSNYFQDKYVHRSHSNSIGMNPRINKEKYHREYYETEYESIEKEKAKIFYSQVDILEEDKLTRG
jgi:hypothetical protein